MGYSKSFGAANYKAYLIKTDVNGDTLWTKIYGGATADYFNAIELTNDGGYLLAGYTNSFVTAPDSGNIYLVKTDASGSAQWTKSYGGSHAISDGYGIKQTADKGFIITGYTNAFSDINGDAFLIKTDSAGNSIWSKTYGSPRLDWGNAVKQTLDGGYILTGSASFDTTKLIDVYLLKTNASGDTLWSKTYGGTGYDFGQTLEITNDGGFVITGYTNSCDSGNYDMFILKTDANGNMLWFNEYDLSLDDESNALFKTNDGGYIIGGITTNAAGNYDVQLIKTDAYGKKTCSNKNCAWPLILPPTKQAAASVQSYSASLLFNSVKPVVKKDTVVTSILCITALNRITDPDQNQLSVYPNPSRGYFTVLSSASQADLIEISIVDILGRVVFSGSFVESICVDFQKQTPGTYFVKCRSFNKNYVGRIIISQ